MPDKPKMPPPDYQVRNEEVEATLKLLGMLLGEHMPDGFGFTLLLFDTADRPDAAPGSIFYISSVDRGDMIVALKEFIKKQEM